MTTVNGELPKALIRAEIVYFEPLCVMFRPDGDTQIGCRARLVEVPHQNRVFAQRRREFRSASCRMPGETKFALEGKTAKPSLISSRVIASRPAATLAQLSQK